MSTSQLKRRFIEKLLTPSLKELGLGVLFILTFIASIPLITYAYYAKDLHSSEAIMNKKDTGVILLDRNGQPFYSFYQGRPKEHVTLDKISPFAKQAVIVAEDKEFYHHPGFSFKAIIAALVADSMKRSLSYGGSTITQQLVKNSLLSPEKDFMRKYQEFILAQELERRFSKDQILEMYLNSVYFGEGAFGIEDASRRYFGKSASELTLSESTLLAAVLPAPSKLSPISGDGKTVFERQKDILQEMEETKVITPTQKNEALAQEVSFKNTQEDLNQKAVHFALMVKDFLVSKYGEEMIARSGYKVKTTLNPQFQEYAQQSVAKHVEQLKKNNVSNGAAVVEDPKTGEVLALIGSKNWFDSANGKVNITTSLRSPGSAFKPLVYAAALESKTITPATVLDDSPITYKAGAGTANQPYSPTDYDRKFRGKVLARRALVNSLNIPTVQVLQKIGLVAGINFAKKIGISTLKDPSNYGLSFALGAAEVKLLELTHAYSAFANDGKLPEQTLVLEIRDKYNKKVYSHRINEKKVIDEGVAFQISSILSDNPTRSEVFGSALNISRQAAVKTGTAEDFRDALTIGYTPSLLVGVWVGNNSGEPMDRIAGSLGAAPIWKDLMEQFLKDTPPEKFSPPTSLTAVAICKSNGLKLKDRGATSSATEYFLKGTEPSAFCNVTKPSPKPSDTNPSSIPAPQPSIETPPVENKPQGEPEKKEGKKDKSEAKP